MLTKLFEAQIVQAFSEPMDNVDYEFREHLVLVFNQVLQNVRKEGLSEKALEKIGKLLFRLYRVFQAYKKKKKRYTAAEWLEQLIEVGGEVRDA